MSHSIDITTAMIYAMELTPLIKNPQLDMVEYVADYINRFNQEVSTRLGKFL